MIIDTSLLLAALDRDDAHHEEAKAVLASAEPKVIPEPVIVETAYFIRRRYGATAEATFVRSLTTKFASVEQIKMHDRERIADLLDRYADARIGYADAAIVAVAERLGETVIATWDRRDFGMIRPNHVEVFTLIP